MVFQIASTDKMKLLSNGNFLIGTTTDSGSKLYVNGIIRTTGGGIQAPYTHGFNIADSGGGNRYGLKFGSAGSVGDVNLMMLTNRSYRDATGGGQVAIAGNSNTTGVTEVEITRFDARASTAAGGVQSKVSMDSVLELTAQETPADPASGKSVIWMTSAGDLKVKINVGGTTNSRTIVTYE